jgi:hypothetical protein
MVNFLALQRLTDRAQGAFTQSDRLPCRAVSRCVALCLLNIADVIIEVEMQNLRSKPIEK